MPFQLCTYRRIEDLESMLRGLPPVKDRMFLVAGSGDRELLKGILAGSPAALSDYKIRRWDELYRYFSDELRVEKPRVQLDPPDHWLLLHGLVERYRGAGGELPAGARRRGFLSLLGDQIRELISEEVMPEHLQGLYAEDDVLGRCFTELYRAYLDELDKNGLSDSAGVTSETRRLLDLPGGAEACKKLDLVLVGFSSLTHSQLALVRALVRLGAAVRLCAPVSDMAEAYGASQQFGVEGENLSRSFRPFQALRLEGGDPRQELETAARSLALWEQGQGELASLGAWPGWENVAFSVPRGRLAEAREVFSRYGLPCFWNFRLKLSETPLWRLSQSCLDAAAGGWQTEPVLRLLSEPWLCGASLDVRALRARHPRGADAWARALQNSPEAQTFEDCRLYAEKVNKGGAALDLLTALRELAGDRAREVARAAAPFPELDEEIRLFGEAKAELDRKILFIREVVRDLGELGAQKLSGGDAAAYLQAWAEGTTVAQPLPLSGCMTVFADTPPTLFHCSLWFLAGAEASKWPGGLKESPMLAEAQKEQLHAQSALGLDRTHLPLLVEQRRQREFLFRRLIACGDRCSVICRSAADAEERPQEETTLLRAAESGGWVRTGEPTIRRGLGDLLAGLGEAALLPVEARTPNLWAENSLPEDRIRPAALGALCGSVSLSWVDDYALCPYLFALRRVIRCPEPSGDGEYDFLRGGSAVHSLWEGVWAEYARGGCVRTISALASELFEGVMMQYYPELLWLPSLRRAKENLLYRVSCCARFQDDLELSLRPLRARVECEYDLPPMECGGVTFKGRCDRVDVLKDGRFLLWDYKTGKSDRYKSAFQLACYALALEGQPPVPGHGCAGWGYVGQSDAGLSGLWDDDLASVLAAVQGKRVPRAGKDKNARLEEARALLTQIVQSVKSGVYVPDYGCGFCGDCAFAALCRRGEMDGEIDAGEENEGGEADE